MAACVFYVLKAVLDPDLPPNAGAYRPVEVKVRDGSMLSAVYPQAVCNANIITSQRIVDVLLGALAKAVPERVQAACSGTMNLLNVGGINPRNSVYYNYIETYGGGQGAMVESDGMDAVQNHMTNTRNAPVESIEVAYPLIVESYGMVPDSEGPGEYRGGVGIQRSVRVIGNPVQLTLSSDRAETPPWGLFGGYPAKPSRFRVKTPDGNIQNLGSKFTTRIEADHVMMTETPGGGGWGDARTRDPEAVRRDVIEGLVSLERARDVYAVVLDSRTLKVREQETHRLREVDR